MELLANLTINGLATGMLIFLLAAGLTLIFGLMSVLNFAHGGFFAWGAYSGVWLFGATGNFFLSLLFAMVIGLILGAFTERFIIKPVYGNHVQQILITLGLMLVLSEMLKVVWGPNPLPARAPEFLSGSWMIGDIVIIKYRAFLILCGILVFIALQLMLKKSKLGLVVRAGVMNKEMVEALGINIKRIFMIVFMIGSAMAALGGALMTPYSGSIHAEMGMEFAILAFIVVVIGGMGSLPGSLFAAMLVGLSGSYVAYFYSDLSLAVNMLLMIIVLSVRPEGLFKVKG